MSYNKKDIFLALDTQGHTSRIDDIIVTKDQNLISGSNDKTIRIWDKNGNTIRKILGESQAGNEGKVYALALSPDEKYLVVGGYFPEHVHDIRNLSVTAAKISQRITCRNVRTA